jgi:hypothetical protein
VRGSYKPILYDNFMRARTKGFNHGKANCVVIFTHARANLLEQSIQNFLEAEDKEEWSLVIVQQAGSLEIDRVLKDFESEINLLVRFCDIGEGVLGNINYSRLIGTSMAFDLLGAQIVLGVEEDTKISKDALVFIQKMQMKYGKRRRFRGVNLCSLLPLDDNLKSTYSILRFSLSGQAGAINRNTWEKFDLDFLLRNIGDEEWASRIEPTMKTGFTIHPNNSRLYDQGWGGYSGSGLDSSSQSFVTQHASWVGDHVPKGKVYLQKNMDGVWRSDAIPYKSRHNLYFDFRRKLWARKLFKVWKIFKLPITNPENNLRD